MYTGHKLDKVNGGYLSLLLAYPKSYLDNAVYHPLGGAIMGKACDYYGRVNNYKRLYVNDSALIPGSTAGANPSFTVAAIAERNIENIIAHDF
jgi:cholesterol oxidase